MTGYLGMWEYIESLSSRIKLGMFVARLFNSPFQFETRNMQQSVCNAYDVDIFYGTDHNRFLYFGLRNRL